jgi:hypothetical protein
VQTSSHPCTIGKRESVPKHDKPLHGQKMAVYRAIQILEEIYPARILQKKANKEGAKAHLEYLEAALETMDGLCEYRDMRDDLS